MIIDGVSRTANGPRPIRRRTGGGSFPVEADRPVPAEATVETAGVAMTSLLALQEAQSGAERDREAQRHGEAVVDALGELQLALLDGRNGDLEALARLAARPVAAADPALAGLMRTIQLRAGIELARRGRAASM